MINDMGMDSIFTRMFCAMLESTKIIRDMNKGNGSMLMGEHTRESGSKTDWLKALK